MKIKDHQVTWPEAVMAIAAVAGLLWGIWEHTQKAQKAMVSTSQDQVIAVIKAESVQRKQAIDALTEEVRQNRQINKDAEDNLRGDIKSLADIVGRESGDISQLVAQMGIVLKSFKLQQN